MVLVNVLTLYVTRTLRPCSPVDVLVTTRAGRSIRNEALSLSTQPGNDEASVAATARYS
jgi:hypothetical protein